MKFCDTTVLVAAVQPGHVHHDKAFPLYIGAQRDTHAVAAHSMAEMYSTLSGAQRPKVTPESAFKLVDDASKRFALIALDPQEILATAQRCSVSGIAGGTVYDALILACARKVQAETIYTFNLRHFQRIAPDLASIILEP
jgi:predicted nucleic acid-binding protein